MNFVFRDIADMEHAQSAISCLQFVLNLHNLKLIVIIYSYINIRYNNINTCTYTAYEQAATGITAP